MRRSISVRKTGAPTDFVAEASSPPNGADWQEVTTQVGLLAGESVEAVVSHGHIGETHNLEAFGQYTPEFSMTWLAPGP